MSKKSEIEYVRTVPYVYLFKKSTFELEELDMWDKVGEIGTYFDRTDERDSIQSYEVYEFSKKCNDGTINPSEWYMYFDELLAD